MLRHSTGVDIIGKKILKPTQKNLVNFKNPSLGKSHQMKLLLEEKLPPFLHLLKEQKPFRVSTWLSRALPYLFPSVSFLLFIGAVANFDTQSPVSFFMSVYPTLFFRFSVQRRLSRPRSAFQELLQFQNPKSLSQLHLDSICSKATEVTGTAADPPPPTITLFLDQEKLHVWCSPPLFKIRAATESGCFTLPFSLSQPISTLLFFA